MPSLPSATASLSRAVVSDRPPASVRVHEDIRKLSTLPRRLSRSIARTGAGASTLRERRVDSARRVTHSIREPMEKNTRSSAALAA
jgi:hypothetical protein